MLNINKPTLLLNESICRDNIRFMSHKTGWHNLTFRPHFKTHQSEEIAEWFREYETEKITVSSVSMAEYFAANGWNDITIAFPVNILEMDAINKLGERIILNLLVESVEAVEYLASNSDENLNLFIKIDTGSRRAGLDAKDFRGITNVVSAIENSAKLSFSGFLSHAGHTYKAAGKEQIGVIHKQEIDALTGLKKLFRNAAEKVLVSIGDTPSCTSEDYFTGVDEIRPGNFVFYDVMQYERGVCRIDNIAVCLACPVVSLHRERNEVLVYGGAVHLSKESLTDGLEREFYGLVVKLTSGGWSTPLKDCFVKSLSQEHGVIKMSERDIKDIQPGDLIGILPVHSCLTANLMNEYLTLDNKTITMMR